MAPSSPLRFLVSDLLARQGQSRSETSALPVSVDLPNASVDADAVVTAKLTSLSGGIVAKGSAEVEADLSCNRCLMEWSERLEVPFEQIFRMRPDEEDDELPIEQGQWVDLAPVVHDEIALALPATPVCQEACKGLCPECGTDLNTDPCDCLREEPRSPFAALKQLFEP